MQEYKDWDGTLLLDPAPTVQHVHIGDIIKIKINDEDRIGRTEKISGNREHNCKKIA